MPDLELPDVLARRAHDAPARAGSTRVVAVDGPSGAGKSTLAAALADRLAAQVVLVDDLMPGWAGLDEALRTLRRDVLEPLSRGQSGGYQRYDWVREQLADHIAVPAGAFLVVDGCGSGGRELAPYLSLLVWVDAGLELRFERSMVRDGEVFRPHWDRWERETQARFAREGTAGRADVVVDGS
ncbi:MAG: AAA family ATPase [Actinomycetales bacterium]